MDTPEAAIDAQENLRKTSAVTLLSLLPELGMICNDLPFLDVSVGETKGTLVGES